MDSKLEKANAKATESTRRSAIYKALRDAGANRDVAKRYQFCSLERIKEELGIEIKLNAK